MSAKQSSGQSSAPRKQSDEMVQRIAKLTRMLRDSMRALGLDEAVKEAAEAIPDARERLRYVGRMTEQAANRVLTAAEQTQPLQAGLSTQADELRALWQGLAGQTRSQLPAEFTDRMEALLQNVEQDTAKTQAYLLEIIMAQDFQDLTGQVIQGMLEVITAMEKELIQVLLDSVPTEKREETLSLLNGPVVNPEADDVVRDQDEVDDLLSSLGF